MEIEVSATGATCVDAISKATVAPPTPTPIVDQQRLDAMKQAANTLVAALGFAADDVVEVHMACSDTAKWATVNVAQILKTAG